MTENQTKPAFLNDLEMQILTGYKATSSQKDWLNRNGWIYSINAKGVPVVARHYCELKLSGGSVNSPYPEPDFSKINQSANFTF